VGLYFGHKAPSENFVALGNAIIYPRYLGAIFLQMFLIVKIETLDLRNFPLCLFMFWPLAWRFFFYIVMMP
jgi:hypothetical protein